MREENTEDIRAEPLFILFYGNCQVGVMNYFLRQCQLRDLETNKYFSHSLTSRNETFEADLQRCHVFVYQPVLHHRIPEFGTDAILARLPSSTIRLSIQNLFFSPYYPGAHQVAKLGWVTPLMLEKLRDTPPDQASASPLPDAEELLRRWRATELARRMERNFDVEMSDWVEEHYAKQRLFYTPSHCANAVYLELMRRIFARLEVALPAELRSKLPDFSEDIAPRILQTHEVQGTEHVPIMPEVAELLKLEFDADCGFIPGTRRRCTREEYMLWLRTQRGDL